MKNLIGIILFSLSLMSCAKGQSLSKIEVIKGYHLSDFYKAGTTVQLKAVYEEYIRNNDLKKGLSSEVIQSLKNELKKSESKKHKQKKIGGIYAAIEMCSNDKCFCFLLTEEIVYDISNNVEYHISKETQSIFKNLFGL